VNILAALHGRITPRPGVPLRVEVYDRIAGAIRSGDLPPLSLLPSESELGEAMEVSRTVVREAVLLLEEDGLLRSRRGIGRFVASDLPAVGFEHLQPIEVTLRDRFPDLTVRRTEVTRQAESALFIAEGLGISPQSPSWFIESVLSDAGEPLALLQEHLPAGPNLEAFGSEVRGVVERGAPDRTCLGALVDELNPPFRAARSELAVGIPGAARAKLLGVRPSSPVLIVTQSIHLGSSPLYLAKVILRPEAGPLEVSHSR
jgi:GntR family transcriptional regulator